MRECISGCILYVLPFWCTFFYKFERFFKFRRFLFCKSSDCKTLQIKIAIHIDVCYMLIVHRISYDHRHHLHMIIDSSSFVTTSSSIIIIMICHRIVIMSLSRHHIVIMLSHHIVISSSLPSRT